MSEEKPRAYLLPLDAIELQTVLDALVQHAYHCEADGDPCGEAPVCDAVAARCRQLLGIRGEAAEQVIRLAGLGRYRNRPQG